MHLLAGSDNRRREGLGNRFLMRRVRPFLGLADPPYKSLVSAKFRMEGCKMYVYLKRRYGWIFSHFIENGIML
jgi:hypothetical protein